MSINSLEHKLTSSREDIRSLLTQYMNTYTKSQIDFSKTRFFSYLIDVMSILYSDEIFYNNMGLKESILDTATLPESIAYLSSYIGYKGGKAKPATGTVMISFPVEGIQNGTEITFPSNMQFYANDIKYRIGIGDLNIYKSDEGNFTARLETIEGYVELPIEMDEDELHLNIEVEQSYEEEYSYMIDYDIKPFQFYILNDNITSGQITDVDVYVKTVGSDVETKWTAYDSLYLMGSETEGFVYNIFENEFNITFGNGILGKQPNPGDNVRVVVSVTNGSYGNVVNDTIRDGDRVYYGSNTILNYDVTNPFSFDTGEDYEPPESVKANAKKSFVAFNRLTSQEDFNNINAIIPEFPFNDSHTVLKRSDLKSNEIDIYNVMFMNGDILPSRTETLHNLDSNSIPPYEIFTVDGFEYYNLFQMDLDSLVNQVDYTYVTKQATTTGKAILPVNDLYPFFLKNVESNGDYDLNTFTITLNVDKGYDDLGDPLDASDIKVDLRLSGFSYDKFLTLDYIDIDDEHGKYVFTLDMDLTPVDNLKFNMKFYDSSNGDEVVNIYDGYLKLKQSLKNILKSEVNIHTEPGHPIHPGPLDYDIYDVPLVNKEWYDSLEDDVKRYFESFVIAKMIIPDKLADKRMINIFNHLRFSNSHGYIKNIYLNIPEIKISKFITDSSELPPSIPAGYKVIVKGPVYNSSDIFYTMEGSVITAKTDDPATIDDWNVEMLPVSKMVLNEDDDLKYFYNGRIWTRPQMKLPIEFEFILHTTDGNLDIQDQAKDLIMEYYAISGHDTSIYRSDIIALLQTIPRVKYVTLLKPEIDILYNYNVRDFTVDELLMYTPEYLYTVRDNIKVKVEHYRNN